MALLIIGSMVMSGGRADAQGAYCETYWVTGYAASDYPGWTADSSTTTVAALNRGEPIAAGSYNLPFGTMVDIDGLGRYRIADRGHLGARHIDVLVWTRAEAYALTGYRTVCVE